MVSFLEKVSRILWPSIGNENRNLLALVSVAKHLRVGSYERLRNSHLRCICLLLGMASMTVPMYLAECAPVHLRGRLTVADNMAVTGGQFAAGIIDYAFSYTAQGWRSGLPLTCSLKHFIYDSLLIVGRECFAIYHFKVSPVDSESPHGL